MSLRGEEVMVTTDLLPGLDYFDTGLVVKENDELIFVRFPGRLKPVEIPRDSGQYEPLGPRGMEPGEQ